MIESTVCTHLTDSVELKYMGHILDILVEMFSLLTAMLSSSSSCDQDSLSLHDKDEDISCAKEAPLEDTDSSCRPVW